MDYFNNCVEYIYDLAQNCQDMMDCVKKDIFIDKVQKMAEEVFETESKEIKYDKQ